jgi:predicted RNA binding protein YcfA (HicA-like mRNA interferase family)
LLSADRFDVSCECVYITHHEYKLPVNSREIIRRIEQAGWVQVGSQGSHWQFKHPTRPGRVTVPYPARDLPIGTVRSIEKQSGVKLR